MPTEIIKSSSQLEYEIQKTKSELVSLQKNWKQKKNASLTKLVSLRADKKELDAVLAETEKGYQAYCLLLNPIAELANFDTTSLNASLQELENLDMEFVGSISLILQQVALISSNTGGAETNRVLKAREQHQIATENILQKSREIYQALKEEQKTVTDYEVHLTGLIQNKQLQIKNQNQVFGKGL